MSKLPEEETDPALAAAAKDLLQKLGSEGCPCVVGTAPGKLHVYVFPSKLAARIPPVYHGFPVTVHHSSRPKPAWET